MGVDSASGASCAGVGSASVASFLPDDGLSERSELLSDSLVGSDSERSERVLLSRERRSSRWATLYLKFFFFFLFDFFQFILLLSSIYVAFSIKLN